MLSVHNALNQPSNPKLISGSRRTGSIGELEVPGDHQIPAVPRSPTPSTRPKDPYLIYNQPGHQKKPTNESFPTPPSPSRVLENSSSTTIPTTQAAAAATPQAAKLASIVAQSHDERTRTRTTRSATSPSTVIDTTKPRASVTSSTAAKKPAAANPAAQLQAAQTKIATKSRDTKASTTTARDTTGTATIIGAAKPRAPSSTIATTDKQPAANVFAVQQVKRKNVDAKLRNAKLSNGTERKTPAHDAAKPWHALWTTGNTTATCIADTFLGTLESMPRDGANLFHSLKLGDAKKLRMQHVTWLRANPNYLFRTSTLAEYVLDDTGEPWVEYCNRMQREHTHAGLPELVAVAQVQRVGIRIFDDAGHGRFHLKAILGEEFITSDTNAATIDLVHGSNHYDSLIGARLLKPWEHEVKQADKLMTPASHGPEKTSVSATPKEPATLTPRELEKTAVSAVPKEPETTTSETVHAEVDPATEAAVLKLLEQQRHSMPLDLHTLLAHPDPLPMLGERLYKLIECHNVTMPGKITGMLLDGLSLDELHSLLVNVPPGDAAAEIASWIDTALQVLHKAAEGAAIPPGETTKEPKAPAAEPPKVHDELAACEEPECLEECEPRATREARTGLAAHEATDQTVERKAEHETSDQLAAPKKTKKTRSTAWKLRKVRRARDARKTRKVEARELQQTQVHDTQRALASQQLEARQAREQHEAWKRRDEMREFNKEFALPETWPRPEACEWKPIFATREVSKMQANEDRATHVRLLFTAISTPTPSLLGIALYASVLRSSPHAPARIARSAAPGWYDLAPPRRWPPPHSDARAHAGTARGRPLGRTSWP